MAFSFPSNPDIVWLSILPFECTVYALHGVMNMKDFLRNSLKCNVSRQIWQCCAIVAASLHKFKPKKPKNTPFRFSRIFLYSFLITHLFKFEDVLVEVMLESLVGKVDAELLKTVVLIVLETKDVKHANGQELGKTFTQNNSSLNQKFPYLD